MKATRTLHLPYAFEATGMRRRRRNRELLRLHSTIGVDVPMLSASDLDGTLELVDRDGRPTRLAVFDGIIHVPVRTGIGTGRVEPATFDLVSSVAAFVVREGHVERGMPLALSNPLFVAGDFETPERDPDKVRRVHVDDATDLDAGNLELRRAAAIRTGEAMVCIDDVVHSSRWEPTLRPSGRHDAPHGWVLCEAIDQARHLLMTPYDRNVAHLSGARHGSVTEAKGSDASLEGDRDGVHWRFDDTLDTMFQVSRSVSKSIEIDEIAKLGPWSATLPIVQRVLEFKIIHATIQAEQRPDVDRFRDASRGLSDAILSLPLAAEKFAHVSHTLRAGVEAIERLRTLDLAPPPYDHDTLAALSR